MPFYSRVLLGAMLVSVGLLTGCTKKDKPTIWIYTSLYNFVVQDLNVKLEKQFPEVDFKWFQSGSENISAKIQAEMLAGRVQADLILTSDVFLYEHLKEKNALLSYRSPRLADASASFRDPDLAWVTCRFSTIVMAYNSDLYTEASAPKSFADLTQPRFKDKVSMGSPLESGTVFTAVAFLSKKLGWDYFQKMRANGIISAGGNSAVIAKMETKERPVGIVLLENVLAARKKNPKLVPVYPAEGVVLVPGPIAITAKTPNPEIAKQVYDYLLSTEAAAAIRQGMMHSYLSTEAPPEGAEPFELLLKKALPWSNDIVRTVLAEQNEIKRRFSKLMYE